MNKKMRSMDSAGSNITEYMKKLLTEVKVIAIFIIYRKIK